jgi:hypothetical protein
MKCYFYFLAGLLLSVMFIVNGCGHRGVPVVLVSGEVWYNGQTVEDALLSFVPQFADGRGASAMTDSNGKFVLVTQGAVKNGAVPGEYKILVTKLIEVDESGKKVIRQPKENKPGNTAPEIRYPQKNLLPEKYSKKDTTTLTVTVGKKENYFKLELTD